MFHRSQTYVKLFILIICILSYRVSFIIFKSSLLEFILNLKNIDCIHIELKKGTMISCIYVE